MHVHSAVEVSRVANLATRCQMLLKDSIKQN